MSRRHAHHRPFWRLTSALALAAVSAIISGPATSAHAASVQAAAAAQAAATQTTDDSPAFAWTQTSLTEPTLRLFTPASGALFARTPGGLQRSDDAAQSWRAVSLPAAPEQDPDAIVVDPTNHATIYLAAKDGVYKTEDDAASWRMILPNPPSTPDNPGTPTFEALAVSPANPSLIYVMYSSQVSNALRFQRSPDGGQTWETLPETAALPPGAIPQKCYWGITVLQPHATDLDRVFRAASCNIRGSQVPLKESRDGGQTLSGIIYEYPLGRVTRLAGGQPDAPQRLYLGVNKDYRGGGSLVVRSDDDGATWRTLMEYSGGGGMSGGGPDVTLAGLALDPTSADRVLVGLNASQRDRFQGATLRLSVDGGASWTDATPDGMGKLTDVAFGVDRRLLFAAGESGVWRATAP